LLAVYFITQYDFANSGDKFGVITQFGTFLNRIAPKLNAPVPHPNNVAGILEIAFPICLALTVYPRHARATAQSIMLFVLLSIIGLGLVMTASRGAWLAIGIAGALIVLLAWINHDESAKPFLRSRGWLIGLVVVAGLIVFGAGPVAHSIGTIQTASGDFPRSELYRQVWGLIQDYAFTGAGLASFPMVYSTYQLLIQVYFLPHAHNIFLQIWIEQGLLGIVAFTWLIVALCRWVWQQRGKMNWLVVGGIGATAAMLVHGLIDAPLWYSDVTTVFLFLPIALTAAGIEKSTMPSPVLTRRAILTSGLIGVASLASIAAIDLTGLGAMWFANLGAVSETRQELSRYNFPNTLVEYVRRDGDFSESESFFRQALAIDSGNVTANQRMGQLALAHQDYESAKNYFLAADERDPANPVTWQLLGAAYLGLGQIDNAHEYWARFADAPKRLESESWVRYETRGDHTRAQWALALAKRIQTERGTK
jgi:hypothetical protein